MKTVQLSDILTKSQLLNVEAYLLIEDKEGLKKYLNSLTKELELVGVLPDYLYYQLCYLHSLE